MNRFTGTSQDRARAVLVLAGAALAASITPGWAGPCTAQIVAVQAQVDAKLEAIAGAGRTGRESTGALLHRQPTPESVARAETNLGEGAGTEKALAALARARELDLAGDAAACEQALAEARRAIGP
jgi:hypothetical protein